MWRDAVTCRIAKGASQTVLEAFKLLQGRRERLQNDEIGWQGGENTCKILSNRCECAVLREYLEAGEFYISDRCYGEDYVLFEELAQGGWGFLIQLRKGAVIHVIEPNGISAEAGAQSVRLDA